MLYRFYFWVPAVEAWDKWCDAVWEAGYMRQIETVKKQADEDMTNATQLAQSLESTAGIQLIAHQREEEKIRAELRTAKRELGDAGEVMAVMESDMRDMMTLHEETEAVHKEELAEAEQRCATLLAADREARAAGMLMALQGF